jgi:cell division protein FtsN
MSKSTKGGGGSGKGGSLFAGIVLGMVLGLIVAGAVAWYITAKNPGSFADKGVPEAGKPEAKGEPLPPQVKSASASAPVAASGVSEQPKQHFEFYKVLTDNRADGGVPRSAEKAPAAVKEPVKAAASKETFYVQAGSFSNVSDAEKLKAKLALLGLEASLRSVELPDKGTYHRVRLGPFKGGDELNKAMALLKQNGVANATPMKAQ